MTTDISVDTLRTWLDEKRPVTVLDVRTDEERSEWWIPGSVHVDAYRALQANELGPLSSVSTPPGQPVVTVCGAGRTSRTAAELLAARGVDARSLAGGMKAWSLAWNLATVPLSNSAIQVVQIRRTGKGCLSYLVASAGVAAVIDPSLPADVYLEEVRRRGLRITTVVETHVHADHLSRARDLAARAGASLRIPAQTRLHFPFTAVSDGDRIEIGEATLMARHTPGHTEESTSYLLNDEAVLTGDTLFTKGVGRPDLHGGPEAARPRAEALFRSIVQLNALPPDTLVLPAHTSEPTPFDGRAVTARVTEIRAWLAGWIASEPAFVERVLRNLPATPPNFEQIVASNEAGAFVEAEATNLEAGANRCAVS
jgi:glyoxylase-like metal-dependent hydrolase (beta-lactamase superfamily II)/rhodanese-related sulfurtransferase